jgi:hypothetical protein
MTGGNSSIRQRGQFLGSLDTAFMVRSCIFPFKGQANDGQSQH